MLMLIMVLAVSVCLGLLVYFLFSLSMMKTGWEYHSSSPFECGFSSYFFSRFSFSVHYFLVGLIFLFLDLELSFLLPFFSEELMSFKLWLVALLFIFTLLGGLIMEWRKGGLNWCF